MCGRYLKIYREMRINSTHLPRCVPYYLPTSEASWKLVSSMCQDVVWSRLLSVERNKVSSQLFPKWHEDCFHSTNLSVRRKSKWKLLESAATSKPWTPCATTKQKYWKTQKRKTLIYKKCWKIFSSLRCCWWFFMYSTHKQ